MADRPKPAPRGTLPQNPIGTSVGGFSQFDRAAALHADQLNDSEHEDANLRDFLGDTELSDSSNLEGVPEPVLQLIQRSYAAKGESAGSPYAGDELGGGLMENASQESVRMRQMQEQQLLSRRNLLGDKQPSFSDAAKGHWTTGVGLSVLQEAGARPATPTGGSPDTMAPDQNDMASQLMKQQLTAIRQQTQEQLQKKLKEAIKQQIQKAIKTAFKKGANAAVRVGLEGAQAAAAPEDAGITLLTLIAEMNVQLVSKYVLKNILRAGASLAKASAGGAFGAGENSQLQQAVQAMDNIANEAIDILPDQSFFEDFLTIWLDIVLIIVLVILQVISLVIFFGPVLLLLGMGVLGYTTITDLFK